MYEYEINGLTVRTGDIICTTRGGAPVAEGQFWRLVGTLVPGDVDHVAVYLGPGGFCVEAGAQGKVIAFEAEGRRWDAESMRHRRNTVDTFYGIAYPLEGRGLTEERQRDIREDVARYCLDQAAERKPYNMDFLDSCTEQAFYCSQLVYQAYLRHGIDLNTGLEVADVPGTSDIIFPQEIWNACPNRRVALAASLAGR